LTNELGLGPNPDVLLTTIPARLVTPSTSLDGSYNPIKLYNYDLLPDTSVEK
jgi:hypothetical protein